MNKSILEDAARKKKNLHMLYIDYQKAYDSVPHDWIRESLMLYKVGSTIINFISVSMSMWMVDLKLF